MVLYELWKEKVAQLPDHPVIVVAPDGAEISFRQLDGRLAALPRVSTPVIAAANEEAFFADILRAWRDGQAVLPVEHRSRAPALPKWIPPGTALIKHTPGSSGVPRSIFFSAAQVLADMSQIIGGMGLRREQPNLGAISLSHSYGFSSLVTPALLYGMPLYWSRTPFPRVIGRILAAGGPFTIAAVPAMWRAWHEAGILTADAIGLAISSGAPLSLELEQAVYDSCGVKVHNFYGTSECGGICFDRVTEPRDIAGSVGEALPGVELKVEGGRLSVESPAVAMGYDPPRKGDTLQDGRNLTWDLARMTASGEVILTGFAGEAINVAGRKVSPSQLEQRLFEQGFSHRQRIFGVPSQDAERVSEIVAAVQLREGAQLAELKKRFSRAVPGWQMPRRWWIAPESSWTQGWDRERWAAEFRVASRS